MPKILTKQDADYLAEEGVIQKVTKDLSSGQLITFADQKGHFKADIVLNKEGIPMRATTDIDPRLVSALSHLTRSKGWDSNTPEYIRLPGQSRDLPKNVQAEQKGHLAPWFLLGDISNMGKNFVPENAQFNTSGGIWKAEQVIRDATRNRNTTAIEDTLIEHTGKTGINVYGKYRAGLRPLYRPDSLGVQIRTKGGVISMIMANKDQDKKPEEYIVPNTHFAKSFGTEYTKGMVTNDPGNVKQKQILYKYWSGKSGKTPEQLNAGLKELIEFYKNK